MSIDNANFGQNWWCQMWNNGQCSSQLVTASTGIHNYHMIILNHIRRPPTRSTRGQRIRDRPRVTNANRREYGKGLAGRWLNRTIKRKRLTSTIKKQMASLTDHRLVELLYFYRTLAHKHSQRKLCTSYVHSHLILCWSRKRSSWILHPLFHSL